jgi:hypothetical protein
MEDGKKFKNQSHFGSINSRNHIERQKGAMLNLLLLAEVLSAVHEYNGTYGLLLQVEPSHEEDRFGLAAISQRQSGDVRSFGRNCFGDCLRGYVDRLQYGGG